MAGRNSIKLFKFNQKFCQKVGIYLSQSNQNGYSINSINLIFVICLTQFLIALLAFFLFDAKLMRDYGVTLVRLFHTNLAIEKYFKVY